MYGSCLHSSLKCGRPGGRACFGTVVWTVVVLALTNGNLFCTSA